MCIHNKRAGFIQTNTSSAGYPGCVKFPLPRSSFAIHPRSVLFRSPKAPNFDRGAQISGLYCLITEGCFLSMHSAFTLNGGRFGSGRLFGAILRRIEKRCLGHFAAWTSQFQCFMRHEIRKISPRFHRRCAKSQSHLLADGLAVTQRSRCRFLRRRCLWKDSSG